ncbi:hypothetical protein GYMLUDRAFT_55071 [Collybiopsis luxurians FD-317 M1]|nr:hypothetical protein GYMLUDRAFT_55071 [Collybiopsis luxurians FD-317 M1]
MYPSALPTPHSFHPSTFHMDPSAVDFRAFYPYTPNEVKHRKRTTTAQLKILEGVFKRDTKPNAALRNELATQLDMTARGVQVWFQNRRAKEKNKTTKSVAVSVKDSDEPRESLGPTETILLPQSTFPRDLPELGDSSSSQESSPTGSSPPQLHVNTDSSFPSWQSSPLATPEDFRLNGDLDACFIRRGSLPDNAFYNDDGSALLVGHPDPFARRRSVDASLHRLAANPYANLARAKNNAMSGSRFPGHVNDPFPLSRSSSVSLTSNDFSHPPPSLSNFHASSLHARHSSADSRTYRFSPHAIPVSPSPSPMSAYHSSIRSSLPDNQLFAFSTRPVSSPLPGPLPSPDFSFGIASSSITSPASERNSPDNSHGFLFRGEDLDTEDDGTSVSYGGYSRFGSITSIATSDSNTSAYYSDVSNCVDPSNGTELGPDANHQQHRRDSGHFVGLMSGLNVGGVSGQSSQQPRPTPTTASGEASSVTVAPIPVAVGNLSIKEGDGTSTYPSPTSTVSPGASPNERNSSSGSSGLSLSNELMHAFQKQPEVNHHSSLSPSQQHNSSSPAVESEVPFYLAENRYSPIALPSASIEFAGSEYHFVAQSNSSDNSGFSAISSRRDSYPVDAMGQDQFASSGSQDSAYPLFDSIDPSSTTSFI